MASCVRAANNVTDRQCWNKATVKFDLLTKPEKETEIDMLEFLKSL